MSIAIGKAFFKHWYRCPSASIMNDAKGKLFSSHFKTPKLQVLATTFEALEEHIKCAHVQAMLWKAADSDQYPNIDISIIAHKVLYVTPINGSNMAPIPVYGIAMVTLKDVLQVIACKCA